MLARLREHQYFASRELATALFLALKMQRLLFLEGEPGVGKTELAKAAGLCGTTLLLLQCYEGLDTASALYEWDYPWQIMALRLAEALGETPSNDSLYRGEFLLKRPLLQAILPDPENPDTRRVLLIDEIDRADEPFEAFLLELLSDFPMSIPEYGTVRAARTPLVVTTSNRTREVHDALKRRCLYQWIGYPERDIELAIVAARAPEAGQALQRRAVAFVHELRTLDLFKAPGVTETLDWCRALAALSVSELDPQSGAGRTRSACCSSIRTTWRAWTPIRWHSVFLHRPEG
ncbi:carbon monoxide dehydrogenase D protein [Candidatus Paraburkholderia kirkii UZHbot1]|uniref:Carbon monoxide dehydrogenase D protein n=1 Tax=Candidatus Paraburkholderia kirkii UZHbot1 TaxID=1055526 RepID=G4M499_9BURK|nr:carbon monoxide dehydrogenase D protein [Candidatus Paraburkholderia kirkii UZHbot1]